jgi:hypothetical protein
MKQIYKKLMNEAPTCGVKADTSYKQMPEKFLKIRNSNFLKALPLLNSTRGAIFCVWGIAAKIISLILSNTHSDWQADKTTYR